MSADTKWNIRYENDTKNDPFKLNVIALTDSTDFVFFWCAITFCP